MKYMTRFCILFFLFISSDIIAQRFKMPKLLTRKRPSTQWYGDPVVDYHYKNNFNKYVTVGLGGGTSNYYGDLTTYRHPISTILKMTRWNFSANYTKHFKSNLSARVAITYARISGDDNNFENANGFGGKYARGLHFRNDLKEVSLVGMYDLAQSAKGSIEKRQLITPYLFAGIAFANHDPKARGETSATGVVSKEWLKLRELDTEGQSLVGNKQYSTLAFAVPFGMGFRYKINDKFDLSAEGGFRATFGSGGKYLDDISGNYIASAGANTAPGGTPTPSEKFSYRANEDYAARTGQLRDATKVNLNKPLTRDVLTGDAYKRGNGRNDWYFITCFQLNYYIPRNIKCPTPN
jgi:Domain of unknown function (DUF6089)